MRLRAYQPGDRDKVLELQRAHGDHFRHHDPDDPATVLPILLEDEDGALLGGIYARVTLEGFLLLNNERGSRLKRWRWAQTLFEALCRSAYNMGLTDGHFWIRPELDTFAKLVESGLGVEREKRYSYTINLSERYSDEVHS